MPVRNAERTIQRAINSVLCQTHRDFELICVVNGSDDKSESIIRESSLRDSRVILEHSTPGIVPALNRGLSDSRYDIIARQDADDYWYPDKLDKQLRYLSDHPDIDILGVQIRCVDVGFKPTSTHGKRPLLDSEIKAAMLSGNNVIAHPGVVFRRRILERLGGYDDTFPFAEDYYLWLRAMQWYKFSNLNEVLVDYTTTHNPGYNPKVPQILASIFRNLYGVRS